MTTAALHASERGAWPERYAIAWTVLLVFAIAAHLGRDALPAVASWPEPWIIPFRFWISDFMKWLINDFDLGLFTFKELTRSVAWLLEWPLRAAQSLLAEGFSRGIGRDAVEVFPRIPWIALLAVCALVGLSVRGLGLAALVAGAFLYLAVFGQWESAMVTLSSIAITVPLGAGAGLLLGIAGFRSARIERVLVPLLDLMQTVPIFAYLVPILFLFGFGPVAAMIATIIYATPPMVRVTMLALHQVPAEIVEFGRMAGCSRRQLLWKVLVPSARPSLMVGINQVIMLSLNMVIIASMIGAGGLGYDVLTSLKRLRIGDGVEAGLAITLLAIALDRLSQAFANRPPPVHSDTTPHFVRRHPFLIAALATLAIAWAAGVFVPAMQDYPERFEFTTATTWSALIKWININFYDVLEAIKTWLLFNLLIPVKRFLTTVPWPAVVAAVAIAGHRLGGWRLAALTGSLALFMAVSGNWEKSMITVYLCGVSVLIASIHRDPDRDLGGDERPGLPGRTGGHRHAPDAAVIRIPHSGGHAVPGRGLLGPDCGGRLRGGARGALYGARNSSGPGAAHRGGGHLRLHAPADVVEGAASDRASGDHARHQSDHHAGAQHAGDHRAGRHPRSRPGGLYRADQGGYRARYRGRTLRRVHRDHLGPADRRLGAAQEARAGPRMTQVRATQARMTQGPRMS